MHEMRNASNIMQAGRLVLSSLTTEASSLVTRLLREKKGRHTVGHRTTQKERQLGPARPGTMAPAALPCTAQACLHDLHVFTIISSASAYGVRPGCNQLRAKLKRNFPSLFTQMNESNSHLGPQDPCPATGSMSSSRLHTRLIVN